MKPGLHVSGDKKLAKMLGKLSVRLDGAAGVEATETAAKRVLERYRGRVDIETGAWADSAEVRPVTEQNGSRGHEVHLDREKVVETRRARGGRIGYDNKRKEDAFYPAIVEFDGDRPLRTSLEETRDEFRNEVAAEIRRTVGKAVSS